MRWDLEDYLLRIQQNFQPSQTRFLTFTLPASGTQNPKLSQPFPVFTFNFTFNNHLCKNISPHISVYFLYSFPVFLLVIDTPPPSWLRVILLVIIELFWQPGSSGVLVRLHTTCVLKKTKQNKNRSQIFEVAFKNSAITYHLLQLANPETTRNKHLAFQLSPRNS